MYDPNDPYGYNKNSPTSDSFDVEPANSEFKIKKTSKVKTMFNFLAISLMSLSIVSGGYFISQRTGYESEATYSGKSYYLSPEGSDANDGTEGAPFKSFVRGVSVLTPGDRLLVGGGVYKDRLVVAQGGSADMPLYIEAKPGENPIIDGENVRNNLVDVSGSNVVVSGIGTRFSSGYCVDLGGSNIVFSNAKVHDCHDHGIYVDGKNIKVLENEVYGASSVSKGTTASSGWGSGIKVRVGGENINIEKNKVYNNWGEGIAVTRGVGAKVLNNVAYDNFSVNIYVDNSINVEVDSNWSYCNPNSGFERSGKAATAFSLGEEYYDGWGAKLSNIKISNNIGAFCNRGVAYYGADVSGGGLDNVIIVNNTFYGSAETAISLAYEATKTRNTVVANNIVQQPANKQVWIENRTGINMLNNFWVGANVESWTNGNGTGDKYGDVKFEMVPSRDPVTYRLKLDSPAVNGGSGNVILNFDFEGKTRNVIDMGAIEFGTSTTNPTPTPNPTSTPIPTVTPTPSPTPIPTINPTPSPTPPLNQSPVIKTSKLPAPSLNKSYSATVVGTDADVNDVLSMTMTGLPSGLSLGACTSSVNFSSQKQISCVLTGTPTIKGTFSTKVTLTDSKGASVSKTYSLRVR